MSQKAYLQLKKIAQYRFYQLIETRKNLCAQLSVTRRQLAMLLDS